MLGDMETYKMSLSSRAKSRGAPVPKGLDVVKTRMDFTLDKHVEIAWNDLDKDGRSDVDRRRARRFLRCMGWCGTDHELDAMLYGPDPFGIRSGAASAGGGTSGSALAVPTSPSGFQPPSRSSLTVPGSVASGSQPVVSVPVPSSPGGQSASGRKKGIPERFWTLQELRNVSQTGQEERRNNSSVEALAGAISVLAGDKGTITQKDLQDLLASPEIGLSEHAYEEMAEILQITGQDPVDCTALAEKIMQTICRPPSSLELMDVAHTVASMHVPTEEDQDMPGWRAALTGNS